MKTMKKVLVFVMVLAVLITAVPSTVEAKAKTYKTKTVKVMEGKRIYVKTKKKIKSIKISSKDKTFEIEKSGSKRFYVACTTYGVKQTVKVKYTNGYTQKFSVKTVLDKYAQKIVNELKPLLADPDEGLKTILADWREKEEKTCDYSYHTFSLVPVTYSFSSNGCGRNWASRKERINITDDNISEVFKDYSDSEKQAFIVASYLEIRMAYSRNKKTSMKNLYNGTFSGVCQDGAEAASTICRYLDMKSKVVNSHSINHAWCCIYVKDKNGKPYWKGIYTTSYAIDMKKLPNDGWCLSMSQLKKYAKNPGTDLIISCQ